MCQKGAGSGHILEFKISPIVMKPTGSLDWQRGSALRGIKVVIDWALAVESCTFFALVLGVGKEQTLVAIFIWSKLPRNQSHFQMQMQLRSLRHRQFFFHKYLDLHGVQVGAYRYLRC